MAYGLIFALASVSVIVLWRRRSARAGCHPEMRALLALEYELFAFGHVRGWNALETHVVDWRGSKIFSKYPSIASDEVIRTFLIDALRLLIDNANPKDLDQLLLASLRIVCSRASADRRVARYQLRSLECIRRSVLAMRRNATPVAAIRSGRAALGTDEQPSTVAITPLIRLTDQIPLETCAGLTADKADTVEARAIKRRG